MTDDKSICPLCGSADSREVFTGSDRNQRLEGQFRLVRCAACRLERIDPLPDVKLLQRHYPAQYYPQDPDIVIKDKTNRRWQEWKLNYVRGFAPTGRVLDVGTGTRGLLTYFRDAGWETAGTEFSPESARFSRDSWGLDVRDGDIETQGFEAQSFDAVMFWHVLEHLREPNRAIMESHRILKPGGLLVLALPNRASLQARVFGTNWYHLDLPRHIYHFSPAVARNLVERAGFTVIDIEHRSEEHNDAGWEFSLLPPGSEARKNASRFYRKNWRRLSRLLARFEEFIGRGGTFVMAARKAG